MSQCFECFYFDAFHHRCAKRNLITFGPCQACDKFRDVDDNRFLNCGFAEILQIRPL